MATRSQLSCTCHGSTTVVPCTNFFSDHCLRIEVRVKRIFHRIWIKMERPLVKGGPGPLPVRDQPLRASAFVRVAYQGPHLYIHFFYQIPACVLIQLVARLVNYSLLGYVFFFFCQKSKDCTFVYNEMILFSFQYICGNKSILYIFFQPALLLIFDNVPPYTFVRSTVNFLTIRHATLWPVLSLPFSSSEQV